MFDAKVEAVIDRVEALSQEVIDHWQIPRDEAQVLAQLVRAAGCRSICEIGTSYGFSTLHLAAAVKANGGHLHTIDISQKKVDASRNHLEQAGLQDVVTQHSGDAREVLAALSPAEPFDFVFIDAVKEQSQAYLEAVWPRLASKAIVVTDNTRTHPQELAPFIAWVRDLPEVTSCDVPVGNGFEFSIKHR